MALTFDPEFVAVSLLLEHLGASLEVLNLQLHLVAGSALLDEHAFQVFVAGMLIGQLCRHAFLIALQLAQLLPE